MGHRGGLYREPDVAVLGGNSCRPHRKDGGYDGYKVGAELPPIGLGKLEACNFCHRVPFVGSSAPVSNRSSVISCEALRGKTRNINFLTLASSAARNTLSPIARLSA